jgi:methylmalonyl-CoA mutase cobalamin-binding domain/chain
MEASGQTREVLGKIVLGTVKGDIHNLGKNIVAGLLTAAGFEVIDIGIDVATEVFVEKVLEVEPDVLGLSSLMTITIPEQRMVIEALSRAGVRDKVKVIIAVGAVKTVRELLGV